MNATTHNDFSEFEYVVSGPKGQKEITVARDGESWKATIFWREGKVWGVSPHDNECPACGVVVSRGKVGGHCDPCGGSCCGIGYGEGGVCECCGGHNPSPVKTGDLQHLQEFLRAIVPKAGLVLLQDQLQICSPRGVEFEIFTGDLGQPWGLISARARAVCGE